MKGWDPEGQTGPQKPLPDSVQIIDPPVDKIVLEPSSEQKEPSSIAPAAQVEDPYPQPPQETGYTEETFGESATPF